LFVTAAGGLVEAIENRVGIVFRSSARLRTIAAIQATGCVASGSNVPATRQILAKASCSTSSAISRRPAMRSAIPSSSGAVLR